MALCGPRNTVTPFRSTSDLAICSAASTTAGVCKDERRLLGGVRRMARRPPPRNRDADGPTTDAERLRLPGGDLAIHQGIALAPQLAARGRRACSRPARRRRQKDLTTTKKQPETPRARYSGEGDATKTCGSSSSAPEIPGKATQSGSACDRAAE